MGPLLTDAFRRACHKRVAGRRVQRDEVLRRAAGEQHVAGRREQARTRTRVPLVGPAHLAGLVVDRLQHRFGVAAAISAAPSLGILVRIVDVVDAERARGADVEESRQGAETGRRPVGRAALIGRHERAVELRILGRIRNRLALGVIALGPVRLDVFRRDDGFSRGAIEDEEVAIARGLRDELARLAVDLGIEHHRRLRRVPIVRVVR